MFYYRLCIILIALGVMAHAKTIVFQTSEIQCTNMEHPYAKYYTLPCVIWTRRMKPYHNHVQCVFGENSQGTILSGCSPAFGTSQDIINVNYIVNNSTCCNPETTCDDIYTLDAEVSLNNPIHPVYNFLFIIVCVFALLLTCISPYKHRHYSSYYFSRPYSRHNSNTTSWNRIR